MMRVHRVAVALALPVAASAHAAATGAPNAPRQSGYDIQTTFTITANASCGHWATYGGSSAIVDWAVNGVVVAHDASGVNFTNDGSPYTVSIGEASGSTFSEYHAEVFNPEDVPYVACFEVAG